MHDVCVICSNSNVGLIQFNLVGFPRLTESGDWSVNGGFGLWLLVCEIPSLTVLEDLTVEMLIISFFLGRRYVVLNRFHHVYFRIESFLNPALIKFVRCRFLWGFSVVSIPID